MSERRIVCWFSCGAASAVAAKLTLEKHPEAIVARCVVDNEDADNDRFAKDCEPWFGKEIINLRSEKYADCWEVWEKGRYINGPAGAPCTVEMKKKVRQAFQLPNDIHIFGYTADEKERAKRFSENNLEAEARYPLIEANMRKFDCFFALRIAGIELPLMYRLSYKNANCIGCVKGGRGYWNRVRETHPEVFARMAALERDIGASCINGTYLDELDPESGRHTEIELPSCGIFCHGES